MQDAHVIFKRYQDLKGRLPSTTFPSKSRDIGSLLDISNQVDAFVFDAFGVLNIGETPIPGAAERLSELRRMGKEIRILSNAASYNHDKATEKFQGLGIEIRPNEIITSRDVTLLGLATGFWGCIAAPADDLTDIPSETVRLGHDPLDYDRVDGFLFLSSQMWSLSQQELLRTSLHKNPRPVVIANADLAAPRDTGLSLEPGHYGHLLVDSGIDDVTFLGKPFPEAFDLVSKSLTGIAPDRIAMCGDTLHTDILGAAAHGWKTVLVTQDGILAGMDIEQFCNEAEIFPTWRLKRI
jgi:HAD superfamily hydrolase (TIGR01450 family)